MPGIIKNLLIVAAVEGVVLHPPGQRSQRPLQIKYVTHELSPLGSTTLPKSSASAEIHGVVGTGHPVPKK